MPLQIRVPTPTTRLSNLGEFITRLRRYKKSSVVKNCVEACWLFYKRRDIREQHVADAQIVGSYAPRIAILAMAACNEHRHKRFVPRDVRTCCQEYLEIRDSISSQGYLDQEAIALRDRLAQDGDIPTQYLQTEAIRNSCFELTLSRLLRSQHEAFLTNFFELHRAFRIFQIWDHMRGGEMTRLCRDQIFRIDPIHFFRSGFMLFALAHDDDRNGYIEFGDDMTVEDVILEEYQIDPDTCRLVASKIAFDESGLREWMENTLCTVPEFYQKYFPIPLYRHPLIHLDVSRGSNNSHYLIPSPEMFIRGFANSFFSQIIENSGDGLFGEAIEAYAFESLSQAFGEDNVSRIDGDDEHADFLIRNDVCDIVVEVKSRLGGYQQQAIMTTEAISGIWKRLYKAITQCRASIHAQRRDEHPIIGLVIVAEHITAEAMPFLSLAERTGMWDDFDIMGVEVLPWNAIETSLAQTSVASFMDTIKRKWIDLERQSAADLLTFDLMRDSPAHNYEYLQEVKELLFPGRLSQDDQSQSSDPE